MSGTGPFAMAGPACDVPTGELNLPMERHQLTPSRRSRLNPAIIGPMRLIRRLVYLAVGLWVVVELVAIPVSGQLLAHEVASRTHDVTTVHASVGSFPILARAFLLGSVNKVSVTLDQVTGERIPFTAIRFDVRGVGLDKAALTKGKMRITSIDRGTVTATLDLPPGVTSAVSVSGRTLKLGPLSLALRSDLIPCAPTARVAGNTVTLSCTVYQIPPVLLEGAQR